jgi:hypothetical protein
VSESTARSGQQAAIGHDALNLADTLELKAPILVGYGWGGRAACVAAVVRPGLIGGVVALGGYSIQDIAASVDPTPPLDESRDWYQYYFHSERGWAGLTLYRRELGGQLWREWSPARPILDADFDRTAPSFDNPDFVEVVIHSYRHRSGSRPAPKSMRTTSASWPGCRLLTCPRSSWTPPRTRRCTPARVSSTKPGFPDSSTTGRSPAVITSRSTRPPKSRSRCATYTHSWIRRRTAGKPRSGQRHLAAADEQSELV